MDGFQPRPTGAVPTSTSKENTQEPQEPPGVWSDLKATVQEDPVLNDWAQSFSGWWNSAKEYAGQQKATENPQVTEWYEDTKRSMSENFQYAKEKVATDFVSAKTMIQENYVEPGKVKAEEYKASVMEASSSWLDTIWGPADTSPGDGEPQSGVAPEKIPDITEETKTK
eukprot:GHVP01070095.1.p1 GENE.GHVP01070095.1~~GHVP01070095.1.p1  ORF type:complete len:169 (+),score=37.22 GHVP01070095.1:163-669(+)